MTFANSARWAMVAAIAAILTIVYGATHLSFGAM